MCIRDRRKEAFEHYFQEYKRYQNVFLNLLSGHIKGKAFEARLRNFPSTLEASLFEDGVEKALFDLVVRMLSLIHIFTRFLLYF